MNKALKRILPILLVIVIIASILWYLFVYDRDFTRDVLLQHARYFDSQGNHKIASWLYDQAYHQSDDNAAVAIELANQFKEEGNYTQAEVTLSKAIADGGSLELYIALCKTYVEQDKLMDAVRMLDHITDPSIRTQIAAIRPAAPTPNIKPGFYSQYITVNLSFTGGALYLSADGQYPSVKAAASDGTVTLSGGENTIQAIVIAENGLVSPLSIFGYTINGVIEEVTFEDAKLDAAIREALGKTADDAIFSNELWTLKELTLPEGADSYLELSSLPYLQKLTILGSTAANLNGLGSLSSLTELVIRNSSLRTSDLLTVASLPNLQYLTMTGCGISGIENLSSARNLQYLDLSDNSIRDFTALSFMSNLNYLDLSYNALTSLNAASALSSLQHLNVSYNSLTSVGPLASCTQLLGLNISNNAITSLNGIGNLTQLQSLDASFNQLTDVAPLSSCIALLKLDISSNQLRNIASLGGLNGLQELVFTHNQVTSLPTWKKDCALVIIDGSYNNISAVAALSDFINLNTVIMDYNNIAAVNNLASCYNLVKVSVYGNPVTDVSALTERSIIVNYNPLN